MEPRSKHPPLTSDVLPKEGGPDLRTAAEIWLKLAESEARLHLMVELGYMEVGFPNVENFCLDLEGKYRSKVTGGLRDNGKDSPEWKIVKLCMELKMIDERKTNCKLETDRYKMRKKIEDYNKKNSRRSRNIMKNLRQGAARRKKTMMMKYEGKLKHLRRKYRSTEEEKIDRVPDSMTDLNLDSLSIFNKMKYDDKVTTSYEPDIIGDIILTENELKILRLPPNFSMEENLPPDGMTHEEEMAYAKTRITINKELDEKLDDDEGIGEELEVED